MNEKLFPKEVINTTAEYHFNRNAPRTIIIYQIVLGLLIATGLALFFVKVDVSVNGMGVLRTANEQSTVKALVSGRIENVFVATNDRVSKGQVLATIKTDALQQERQLLTSQRSDFQNQVNDLGRLTRLLQSRKITRRPKLASPLYIQEFTLFWQRLSSLQNRAELANKNHERYTVLYDKKFISAAEYDEVHYTYEQTNRELQTLYDEQAALWQADLNALRIKVKELATRVNQVKEEAEFYTLRAPIAGTLLSVSGLRAGSAVAANELFTEISPDAGLIAETYVVPKDIGFIRKGAPVNFQVTAYNYNQWGMASGTVESISADIFTDREQPYFKVRCILDQEALTLQNGYVGNLKKGMTLQARFFVTRRTLFQLLYDKADDWLNPNQMAATNP